jgi:hypothetical protein
MRPGESDRELEHARDWLTPYARYEDITPDRPPKWGLLGMWTDSTDALWLVTLVPDSQWHRGLELKDPDSDTQREGGKPSYFPERPDQVYDTIIERVDGRTGESLGLLRLDRAIFQVVEPWRLATASETRDGWMRVTIWRVAPGGGLATDLRRPDGRAR